MILQEVLKVANTQTGRRFTEAVVAVPSHWDYGQRDAIQLAGHLARLQIIFLNIPVAAYLSFTRNNLYIYYSSNVLTYSFGRSGFKVSVIHLYAQAI
jgi:molecular chaperone DnaK (HSP70)